MQDTQQVLETFSVRRAFDAVDSRAEALAVFNADDRHMEAILKAVEGLPVYSDRQFVRKDIDQFLKAMPFTTKADLRRHFPHGFLRPDTSFSDLVASGKAEVVGTSGTSSDRLQVLWEPDWWDRQEMAALSQHAFAGRFIGQDYREAVLTTPLCSESGCKIGPSTMDERLSDNLLFLNTHADPTRWTRTDLDRMCEEISLFQPTALEADPVYLAALARHVRDSGRSMPRFNWIVLTYEFVTFNDKALIGRVFGCPVYEYYGLTEAGVFFLECTGGSHHFCGTDAVIEIIRPDGVNLSPGTGEAVVTTWGNTAQPLLRYRTGDLLTVNKGPCRCGKAGPTLSSFSGRLRDVLDLPGGRSVTPREIDNALAGLPALAQYACVQETPRSLCVQYVSDGPDDPGDDVQGRLRDVLEDVEVSVKRQSFITPEPSGKYRTVVPL